MWVEEMASNMSMKKIMYIVRRKQNLHLHFTFTFSHLADAFIQSNLHMCDLQCIHILDLH